MLFLGGMDAHRPHLLSRAAMDSVLQVAQKCCVVVWISQLFPGSFLQGLGALWQVVTQSQCQHLGEFMTSCFTVIPCVLLMCCGNWKNTFCLRANPLSLAALWQRFLDGNASPALPESIPVRI